MSILDDFTRVSRSRPCPVCERPDWCLVSRDEPPSRAICARMESPRRWKEAGWLHRLRDDDRAARRRIERIVRLAPPTALPDLAGLASRYQAAVRPEHVARLAERLGVTVGSLRRLGIGWSGGAWSFPMSDAAGRVRGIRLRLPGGRKLSVRGGKEGLFIPSGLTGAGPLLVAEGESDAAALLDLGAEAIGRPSCRGGTALVVEYLGAYPRGEVVVVADADAVGRAGAADLARALTPHCPRVRLLVPPAEDARQWLRIGATPAELLDAIGAAAPVGIRITARGASR